MVCGFFCDTGAIRGLCDNFDYHHKPCEFFFDKYPIGTYKYYIHYLVEDEINHQINMLLKEASRNPMEKLRFAYLRKVQRCVDKCIKKFQLFQCEKDDEDDLNCLIIKIQTIIGFDTPQRRNDVEIVSNSIMWSLSNSHQLSTLITVDRRDIADNIKKKGILKAGEKCLSKGKKLEIIYLPDYYAGKNPSK